MDGIRSVHWIFNLFTNGLKMGKCVAASFFCHKLGIDESYKLPDYDLASVLKTKVSYVIFLIDILAAIKAIADNLTFFSIV